MAGTSDIKKGMCMEFNNDIYMVVEFLHVKPGKGNAFVRTKLKSVTNGKVVENTFTAGHTINDVRVERRNYQFLYKDEMGVHLMDNESFEQLTIPLDMIDAPQFLKEGTEITVLFHAQNNTALAAEMPQYVILEVASTEPGVKGNTATNAMKKAVLETGAEIQVPMFIEEGDKLKVEVETGYYLERAK